MQPLGPNVYQDNFGVYLKVNDTMAVVGILK